MAQINIQTKQSTQVSQQTALKAVDRQENSNDIIIEAWNKVLFDK